MSQQQLRQVTALHLALLSEQQHQHLPQQHIALGVGNVSSVSSSRYLLLTVGRQLLTVPGVSEQCGQAVKLNCGGLTLLGIVGLHLDQQTGEGNASADKGPGEHERSQTLL